MEGGAAAREPIRRSQIAAAPDCSVVMSGCSPCSAGRRTPEEKSRCRRPAATAEDPPLSAAPTSPPQGGRLEGGAAARGPIRRSRIAAAPDCSVVMSGCSPCSAGRRGERPTRFSLLRRIPKRPPHADLPSPYPAARRTPEAVLPAPPHRKAPAPARSPPLRGRCPAGQRGVRGGSAGDGGGVCARRSAGVRRGKVALPVTPPPPPKTPLCRLRRHLPLKGGDWRVPAPLGSPSAAPQSSAAPDRSVVMQAALPARRTPNARGKIALPSPGRHRRRPPFVDCVDRGIGGWGGRAGGHRPPRNPAAVASGEAGPYSGQPVWRRGKSMGGGPLAGAQGSAGVVASVACSLRRSRAAAHWARSSVARWA